MAKRGKVEVRKSWRSTARAAWTWFLNYLLAPLVVAGLSIWLGSGYLADVLAGGPSEEITISAPGDSELRCVEFAGTASRSAEYPLWLWVRDAGGNYYATDVDDWVGRDEWRIRYTFGTERLDHDARYTVTLLYLPMAESDLLRSAWAVSGGTGEAWIQFSELPSAAQHPTSVQLTRHAGDGGAAC